MGCAGCGSACGERAVGGAELCKMLGVEDSVFLESIGCVCGIELIGGT